MRRPDTWWFSFALVWAAVELGGCGSSDAQAGGPPGQADASTVVNRGGSGATTNPQSTGGTVTIIPVGIGGSGGNPCVGDNPPSSCNPVAPPGCGDGKHNQDQEVCDDGNTVPGDGCNGACLVEPNWTCPSEGACTRNVVCGDGSLGAGEVCDDRNTTDNDGCNSTCTVQDPQYECVPGSPCVRVAACGNGRVEPGEECEDDDGTTPVGGDGCSSTCKREEGWACREVGKACVPAPRCGDGIVNTDLGEVCDDGNVADRDGCAANCRAKGAGCACVPGQLCTCPQPECGNGKLEGDEQCDDGKKVNGDGCSSSCQLEKGYECPFAGAPCVPKCGDGVITPPAEECDPGVSVRDMDKACSTTCQWTDGWACTTTDCHQTTCGDGIREGNESCDDGNHDQGDGCTAMCKIEPNCPSSGGGCSSGCGDGLLLPQPANGVELKPGNPCDDGNNLGGDGCSGDCKVEDGFTCSQPPLGSTMVVPIVVRDFRAGGDFEPADAIGKNAAITGMVQSTLSADGKPVFAGTKPDGYIASAQSFSEWYRDVPGKNSTYQTQLILFDNGAGGYVNRASDAGARSMLFTNTAWCANAVDGLCPQPGQAAQSCPLRGAGVECTDDAQCAGGSCIECAADPSLGMCANANPPQKVCSVTSVGSTGAAGQVCVPCSWPWEPTRQDSCMANMQFVDGDPTFFPLDGATGMITPASEYLGPATIPPSYAGDWKKEANDPAAPYHGVVDGQTVTLHNFHFTSEVRYWFTYDSATAYVLDFTGDDDVWVFINKQLVLDLGGIHTAVNGKVEITNTRTTATVTQTEPKGSIPAPTTKSVSLGLQNGQVYEIVVFQAERKKDSSTYKLTLSGFNTAATQCKPFCGNGVVTAGEQCDNGTEKNLGGYNQCTADCRLGPFCGDGNVDAPDEECDNRSNNDDYGTSSGCAPGCKLPARCGDGQVQIDYGEECDRGADNVSDQGGVPYGADNCGATTCKRGGFCGDAVVGGSESCDDGKNDGTYGTCGDPGQPLPNCGVAPRCGDGVVQSDWGEECEPTASDDPNCTSACRLPGGCGDGIPQAGEQCDYGEAQNTGEYGGCAPGCVWAPRCGDGMKNGPEECDDGTNDGSYGGCTPECKLAGHCGDGVRQQPQEECDRGAENGNGPCTKECKNVIYVPE